MKAVAKGDAPPAAGAAAEDPIPPVWRWHYRALRRIRDQLMQSHEEHRRAICEPFERRAVDPVDVANDATDHDTLLAEIKLEEAELTEVDAALQRLRDGTYGRCEVTGQPISAARLRALPWTRLSQRGAELVSRRGPR